ncbi:unnamed protein product [Oikopleura dioica]|uniref:UBX domain-containing protein n=1 Tax=Oikopleura dioica TaxID=34765 RepID=E4XH53_OIKDI|nr:unnamed protein product [Oikopleura dioica]
MLKLRESKEAKEVRMKSEIDKMNREIAKLKLNNDLKSSGLEKYKRGLEKMHDVLAEHDMEYQILEQHVEKKAQQGGERLGGDSAKNSVISPQVVRFPKVKEDAPKTKVKLRLISGESKVLEVNTDEKVETIKKFLAQFCSNDFLMMSGFPMHPLDSEKTIEEAKLINGSIVQKLQ